MELIVFDLDGTLLNDASEISPFTRETLQLLDKKGIAYTIATGRTLHSAQRIIADHAFELPHIYNNGVMVWNPQESTFSLDNLLTTAEINTILKASFTAELTPFVAAIDADNQHFIFHSTIHNEVEERLLNEFIKRPDTTLLSLEKLPKDANITNISMLGKEDKINAIQHGINSEGHLIAYSGPAIEGNGLKWMDIHHTNASKGGALELLKEQLGFSSLICFGDSDNDLSMFEVADESYAPANANAIVKAAATSVIGHHDDDGVAHHLRMRFEL